MATLELKILAGAESKAWLADLTKLVERMEKVAGKKPAATEEEEAEETESLDEAPRRGRPPGKKKAAASDDFGGEEETEESEEAEEAEETEEEPSPKKKKLTSDDVNDACKARVARIIEDRGCSGADARKEVLKFLQKHFNTTSVSEIEADDRAKAVKLLSGK